MFIEDRQDKIILKIKVIPNSPINCIKEISGDMLKIKINALPENNMANKELISYLSDVLDIKKSDIEIIKGLKSREKIVQIIKANKDDILKKINKELKE